jgi:glycosyltransferase involved in cell wall biosynthesis
MDRLHQKWGAFARIMLRMGEFASLYFPHQTIVVSRQLREYCRRKYGKQTEYIPNGVSREFTRPVAASIIQRKYGLRKGSYILAVSRIIPPKGLHHLVSAYRQLRSDKRLVIVGGSVHTDKYLRQLRALAKQDKRVLFVGFQSGRTLSELYSNAYLYVLPSEIEGMPLSLLEAAGFGRCAVASNIPANVEVLRSRGHDFGIMFRNKNSRDLASKLDLLLKRPALTKSLGQMARELVRVKFNWRHITTDTERIYSAA